MDKFSGMELVQGSGSPLAEGRFAMHEKSKCIYHVFDEDGVELAAFEYEDGNAESQDKALEDALEVVTPHERVLQIIAAKSR